VAESGIFTVDHVKMVAEAGRTRDTGRRVHRQVAGRGAAGAGVEAGSGAYEIHVYLTPAPLSDYREGEPVGGGLNHSTARSAAS